MIDVDINCNPEVLEKIIRRSRYFSFDSKMRICRKIAHLIDITFPNKKPNNNPTLQKLKEYFHMHEIEFLALVFLLTYEVKGVELNEIGLNDFRKLRNLYSSYSPPFTHPKDSNSVDGYTNDLSVSLFFTRTALLQFRHQR